MCFSWKRYKIGHFKYSELLLLYKSFLNHYLPFPFRKEKKNPLIPNFKVKNLKGFLLLYLHAKAKAHPIRLEGIIYSVQSQGLLWKKAQIQKEGQQ